VVVPTPLYRLYVYRSIVKIVVVYEMMMFAVDAVADVVEATAVRLDCVLITTVDCGELLYSVQWYPHT
jgi:hypothetical protein